MPLQIRRGTNAQRQILAVPLASGELLWTTDTEQLFIGDGNTLANALTPVVGYNDENAQDAAAAIFTNGSHTDITFTYVDGANTIDADVSLSAFRQNVNMGVWNLSGSGNITTSGTITAGAFRGDYKGSIFGDDSTTLVNAVDSSINLDGTVKGNIIPDTDLAYDLGSGSRRFNDLYLSGSSIFLGDAVINSVGTAVNLPSGSTIGGQPLGAATFAGTNLNVNIIGDDSSVIVDSSSGNINAGNINATIVTGTFIGDINGSLFADDSSVIIDAIDLKISGIENISLIGNARIEEVKLLGAPAISNIIDFITPNDDAFPIFNLRRTKATGVIGPYEELGRLAWSFQEDGNPESTFAAITTAKNQMFFSVNDGVHNFSKFMKFHNTGKFAINGGVNDEPSAELDVTGDAVISGTLDAAAFRGSLVSDTSTMLIDAVDGRLMVANLDFVGVTGNTPGVGAGDLPNANQWLEIVVNGNTRYIPLYA